MTLNEILLQPVQKTDPPALTSDEKLSYHLATTFIGTILSGEGEVPLPDTKPEM